MPAIVTSTEEERPAAESSAYATRKRFITRPSLRARPVNAPNVPVRPQHKPTSQRRRSDGATKQSPET